MQTHKCYLICATPRSGSFLLCEALKNTSIAGRPEEYFWRGDEPFWRERWGVSTYEDYITEAIKEGTTPNGVFGAKVMWAYFDDFVNNLCTIESYRTLPVTELLATVFPDLHYIWITRRDKVRQAVSHIKALQSNVWAQDDTTPEFTGELHFDFTQIDEVVQSIALNQQAWQKYFAENSIQPITVVYEELVLAYEETAVRVLHELHIAVPDQLVFAPRRMQKQADALSEEWVRRYYELKHS